MTLIEDNIHEHDGETGIQQSSRLPFLRRMDYIVSKRRIKLIVGIVISILIILSITMGSYFYSKGKAFRSFKSGVIESIERDFPTIDSKKKVSYVEELIKIHKTKRISNNPSVELETYVNFKTFNDDNKKTHENFDRLLERFLIFRKNYLLIKSTNGKVPYTLGLTKFSDMSEEEFNELHPEIVPPSYFTSIVTHIMHMKQTFYNPIYVNNLKIAKNIDYEIDDIMSVTGEDLDWRRSDSVTPVKDQSTICGSCWAFSSIASVESAYKLFENKIYNLSEQELINCDKYSHGCKGGLPYTALEYIHSKGVSLSKDLPYHAVNEKCPLDFKHKVFIDSISITSGLDILNKSLVLSPTVVAIAADNQLKLYKGGIYTGKCSDKLNHAVLLVGEGYDPETNMRYWIFKNYWGTEWGENGYLRLERTKERKGKCGILTFGLNPLLY